MQGDQQRPDPAIRGQYAAAGASGRRIIRTKRGFGLDRGGAAGSSGAVIEGVRQPMSRIVRDANLTTDEVMALEQIEKGQMKRSKIQLDRDAQKEHALREFKRDEDDGTMIKPFDASSRIAGLGTRRKGRGYIGTFGLGEDDATEGGLPIVPIISGIATLVPIIIEGITFLVKKIKMIKERKKNQKLAAEQQKATQDASLKWQAEQVAKNGGAEGGDYNLTDPTTRKIMRQTMRELREEDRALPKEERRRLKEDRKKDPWYEWNRQRWKDLKSVDRRAYKGKNDQSLEEFQAQKEADILAIANIEYTGAKYPGHVRAPRTYRVWRSGRGRKPVGYIDDIGIRDPTLRKMTYKRIEEERKLPKEARRKIKEDRKKHAWYEWDRLRWKDIDSVEQRGYTGKNGQTLQEYQDLKDADFAAIEALEYTGDPYPGHVRAPRPGKISKKRTGGKIADPRTAHSGMSDGTLEDMLKRTDGLHIVRGKKPKGRTGGKIADPRTLEDMLKLVDGLNIVRGKKPKGGADIRGIVGKITKHFSSPRTLEDMLKRTDGLHIVRGHGHDPAYWNMLAEVVRTEIANAIPAIFDISKQSIIDSLAEYATNKALPPSFIKHAQKYEDNSADEYASEDEEAEGRGRDPSHFLKPYASWKIHKTLKGAGLGVPMSEIHQAMREISPGDITAAGIYQGGSLFSWLKEKIMLLSPKIAKALSFLESEVAKKVLKEITKQLGLKEEHPTIAIIAEEVIPMILRAIRAMVGKKDPPKKPDDKPEPKPPKPKPPKGKGRAPGRRKQSADDSDLPLERRFKKPKKPKGILDMLGLEELGDEEEGSGKKKSRAMIGRSRP